MIRRQRNEDECEQRRIAARREQQRQLLQDVRDRPAAQRHRVLLPLVGAEEAIASVDALRSAA